MPKPQPTIQRLRELLSYDKLTGVVVWKVGRVGRGCAAGAKVGGPDGKGYLRVCIDGHETGLHRAIWALVTGEWPVLDIDHEDGIGTNNAWKNLRHVTHQVNA